MRFDKGYISPYFATDTERMEAYLDALGMKKHDTFEGADFIMVKPGMPYLDIIKLLKDNFKIPVIAYQVSGEYSIIQNGIKNGLVDKKIIIETLMSFKRAGANSVVTYFADKIAVKIK